MAQDLSLQGDQVVRFKLPEGFEVQRRFIRLGSPTMDGLCEFESRLTVRAGETIEEVELEYDRMTCRSLVAQGRTRSTEANAPVSPSNGRGQAGPSQGAAPSFPPKTAAANSPTYWAAYRTWFRDPIFITLNEVQSKVWWRPNGSCAAGDYVNYEPTFGWFTPSGWSMLDSANSHSATCTDVSLNASAVYQNTAFPTCLPAGATAYYDENYVQGNADGSATGYSKTRRAGRQILCTNLWTEQKKLTTGVAQTVVLAGELGCSGSAPQLFFNVDVPIQGNGAFSTTSSGNDYNGTPLFFRVTGSLSESSLSSDVAMYLDPSMTQHVRTDRCEGAITNGAFFDESCTLIQNTAAGCVPIFMSLDPAEQEAGRRVSQQNAPGPSLYLAR